MVRWLTVARCRWLETGVRTRHGHAIPACRWNDVYTGELSLPKGTKFDIKILKSTVSTTSGGDNTWSAVRYASTLNMSTSHDFGEFTDNLIPNGNFEEGPVKWTPPEAILNNVTNESGKYSIRIGGKAGISSCSSDVFTIPPSQTLRLSGYVATYNARSEGVVTMKIVTPQHQTLFESSVKGSGKYSQFSKTFESWSVPIDCQITLSTVGVDDTQWVGFDTLSLVSV